MKANQKNRSKDGWVLFPVIFALGWIPFIVHMMVYDTNLQSMDWYSATDTMYVDLFLAWKAVAVAVTGVVMAGILLWDFFQKRTPVWAPPFSCMAVYIVMVVFSGILSPYKYWVLRGSFEVFQPIMVILSYVIFCYYTYNYVDSEKRLQTVVRFSGIGIAIILLIGFFQFIGFDLVQTAPFRRLILNPSYWDQMDQIFFRFDRGCVYATLYNPDFISFYCGILIPVIAALCMGARTLWHRIAYLLAVILSLLCIIGAGASSGYLALLAGLLAGGLVLLSRNRKAFAGGIAGLAALAVLCLCLLPGTAAGGQIRNILLGTEKASEAFALQGIRTDDDRVVFLLRNGRSISIQYSFDESDGAFQMAYLNENGENLPVSIGGDYGLTYYMDDPEYGEFATELIRIEDQYCVAVTYDGHSYCFTNSLSGDDSTYYYYNSASRYVKMKEVAYTELFCHDALSGRGEIWNKIIPLLPKHLLLGSGSNTLQLEYPQDDYVYKEYLGLQNIFTVKAHSWPLQEWIDHGLIALLALLAFYLWYAVRSIRIYRRCDMRDRTCMIGFGIFTGSVCYVTAGLANDSNVCTAPVFWVMLGLGMAVNRMISEKEELSVQPGSEETVVDEALENRQSEDKAEVRTETSSANPSMQPSRKKKRGKKK